MNLQKADDSNLNALISGSEQPLAVLFKATWCGPSKNFRRLVEKEANRNTGSYKFLEVDIDDSPEMTKEHNIRATPTLIVFEKGRHPRQLIGSKPENELTNFLR